MTWSELKFTPEELAAKQITTLADRPALSAAEMKLRLDCCDVRERFNRLLELLEASLGAEIKEDTE